MVAWIIVLLPLALTAWMLPLPPYVGVIARVLIFVSVAPGALYLARGLRRTEVRWAGVCLLYLVATLYAALFVPDIGRALLDFMRQVFIAGVSLLLVLYLRNPASRAALAYGMAFMAFVGALVIFALYVSYAGFSLAGLADLQTFKAYASDLRRVPLNPLSFAMVLAFLLAYPVVSRRRWVAGSMTVLILAATYLSGSRTTLLCLLLSALVVGLIGWTQKRPLWLRRIVYFFVVPGLLAATAYLTSLGDSLSGNPDELSESTTGRADLWAAAWEKFVDKPLIGWGAGSWRDNLTSYLPVYDPERLKDFIELEAGGFHNIYLTVLAEKGLLVFIPALIMAAFLLWQSWRLHARRTLLDYFDAKHAAVAPLIVIFVLTHGLGEYAGWWGEANGTGGFVSYAAASLIVATAALLDRPAFAKRIKKGAKEWM